MLNILLAPQCPVYTFISNIPSYIANFMNRAIEYPFQALKEIKRILKPAGKIVIGMLGKGYARASGRLRY